MSNVSFSEEGFEDYLYWQTQDRKTLKRLNALILDIKRSPFDGIGKPEPLKYSSGYWSRRIDDTNRIVYYEEEGTIFIVTCRGHYNDK